MNKREMTTINEKMSKWRNEREKINKKEIPILCCCVAFTEDCIWPCDVLRFREQILVEREWRCGRRRSEQLRRQETRDRIAETNVRVAKHRIERRGRRRGRRGGRGRGGRGCR